MKKQAWPPHKQGETSGDGGESRVERREGGAKGVTQNLHHGHIRGECFGNEVPRKVDVPQLQRERGGSAASVPALQLLYITETSPFLALP